MADETSGTPLKRPKKELDELFALLLKADPKLGLDGIPERMREQSRHSIEPVPEGILRRYFLEFEMGSRPVLLHKFWETLGDPTKRRKPK